MLPFDAFLTRVCQPLAEALWRSLRASQRRYHSNEIIRAVEGDKRGDEDDDDHHHRHHRHHHYDLHHRLPLTEARSLWRARTGRVIHCLHAACQTRRSTRAWAADKFRAQHSRSSTVFIASEKWINQARAAVRVQLLRGTCHIGNYVHGRLNAPLE